MDRFWSLFRSRLWFYLLLCVLSIASAEAATRKYVKMPSDSKVTGSGKPTYKDGDKVYVPGDGQTEYIPAGTGSGSRSLPVDPTYQYSAKGIARELGTKLKSGNVAAIGITIGIQYMLDQIDGIIKDGQVVVKAPGIVVSGGYYWQVSSFSDSDPVVACEMYFDDVDKDFTYPIHSVRYEPATDVQGYCRGVSYGNEYSGTIYRHGDHCPDGSAFDSATGTCRADSYRPATQADFDLAEAAAAAKDSEWLKQRLREHCEGSLAPQKCYDSLRESTSLKGPSTVAGPSETTTGTYTKPDGTTGSTGVTSNTTFNIRYGDNYFDYSKSTTVTKQKDGVPVSEETTTEDEAVTEEEPPEPSSPCTANCDGPAYADQYTPTDQTKEGAIDDYMTRVASVPIIAAGAGFFDVSVGGSCPVWEAHETLDLMGASMPINLVFDFHCAPWFLNFQPYAEIIMLTVCAFLAFRIALLD